MGAPLTNSYPPSLQRTQISGNFPQNLTLARLIVLASTIRAKMVGGSLGISIWVRGVNWNCSICRKRSFALFFAGGEDESVAREHVGECRPWPQHFREKKALCGLAAAAVVNVSTTAVSNGAPAAKGLSIEVLPEHPLLHFISVWMRCSQNERVNLSRLSVSFARGAI